MNRPRMYLRMIGKSFVHRLSRVLIASLSIVVGATTLSALGIVTFTVPEQIARQLRSYGANLVVSPAGAEELRAADGERIDAALADHGVQVVGHAAYRQENLLYNQQPISVLATDFALASAMRPYWSIEGTLPAAGDEVLLGRDLATRYGLAAGDRISVRSRTDDGTDSAATALVISGVLRTGGSEDGELLMGLDQLESIRPSGGRLDMIEYSLLAEEPELSRFATVIDQTSAVAHAQVVQRITKSESGVLATLRTLIWIVSIVVGALTLISVSTTMNAVVSERATELALKKALGASSRGIVGEFFGESVVLGLFGGLIGALGGIAVGALVTQEVFNLNLDAAWWVVPVTMVISAAVSGAGSFVTASRITNIDPALVLGGE
ncbi:ABC transporter permease [Propionicimonas sp.]|uniref:ABC transporter permease n=1 Tax=Propionicimonas sp. TaxID=1955623 RepID=UPI0039E54A99